MAAAPPAAPRLVWLAGALAVSLLAGQAHAQAMSTNSADFNSGYGRAAGSENHPVEPESLVNLSRSEIEQVGVTSTCMGRHGSDDHLRS